MKTTTVLLLLLAVTVATFCSCSQIPASIIKQGATGNVMQFAGYLKMKTPEGFELEIDNRDSWRDTTQMLGGSFRNWLLAAVMERGFDSRDAEKAADTTLAKHQIDGQTKAAEIASNERLAMEKMAIEEAEAAAVQVP